MPIEQEGHSCIICGPGKRHGALVPLSSVRAPILDLIRADHPDLSPEGRICRAHLNSYRDLYVRRAIEADKGQLDELEKEVVRSIEANDILAANTDEIFEGTRTFGERLADVIADFGGSWRFISFFGAVLFIWIALNVASLFAVPFDPFPFILLNLVLSCLAAIQAPLIMMSQKRQESRDRVRAQNDYKINLKAELEIRHLHEKLDHLLIHQWQRLMEIQQIQLELMNEIAGRDGRRH
ncbi:MAG: hypothetical protein CVT83_02680 [Alphaproteobacteria bacterium HGW-Alphaproteobacteria-5]|nr:MAG: hypothetical protein CVT83_02680 [Alphaproteobacteria bacterium HGW-Alphaproteobacteria-5]